MQHAKRLLLAGLCLLLFFALVACDGGQSTPPGGDPGGQEAEQTATAAELMRSVMALTCTLQNKQGGTVATSDGSAVIVQIEEDGTAYLLTNFHVVHNSYAGEDAVCSQIKAAPAGAEQGEGMEAACLWYAKDYDLALLRVSNLTDSFPGAAAVRIAIDEANVGDRIYAVGNTRGLGISVHEGAVSRAYDYVELPVTYQSSSITLRLVRFDGFVAKGDSGGALFSSDGSLLGIVNARQTDNGGGYAIPVSTVWPITEKLLSSADTEPTADCLYFGATLRERVLSTEYDAETGALRNICEVYVDSLAHGSVASAFLSEEDVLLSISVNGGREIGILRMHHATDTWLCVSADDTLTLRFLRNGKEKIYTFTVASSHTQPIK
ncbi:MAG: serine protease [Clostridia bacterium]|nr:serine protease [Clostridia bacterium]